MFASNFVSQTRLKHLLSDDNVIRKTTNGAEDKRYSMSCDKKLQYLKKQKASDFDTVILS